MRLGGGGVYDAIEMFCFWVTQFTHDWSSSKNLLHSVLNCKLKVKIIEFLKKILKYSFLKFGLSLYIGNYVSHESYV